MRVVLFPSAYAPAIGGVEELTRQLAKHLSARGHSLEVWTIRHPHTLPAADHIDGVTVRRFELPLPAFSAGQLVHFSRRSITGIRDLRRAVDEFDPQVLHVQCFSANGIYAAALSRLVRTPLIVTLQGETVMDDQDIYDRSLSLRTGLRIALRLADAVTACSRFVLDDAEHRFGLRAGSGIVVPNGVTTDGAVPHAPIQLPFTQFVLGLGRVVEKKGFDLLLEAFARIASRYPEVGLVIGGDGSARESLGRRARELGLEDRVVLPGALSREHVAWVMANASVFVLPSRIEPFGIVILEALQAGRPVIVSARGGPPEIVTHDRDGLVADPLDTPALADALERVLESRELRLRLSAAGRDRAEEFSWDAIVERYCDIYGSVTGANGDSP